MRTNVRTGETPFRWAYIRSMINQVEVDDREIRIHGAEKRIGRLVMGVGAARQECPVLIGVARSERFELPTLGVKMRFS